MAGAFQESDRPQRGPRSLQHVASIRHALDRKNGERGQVRDVLVYSSAFILDQLDACKSRQVPERSDRRWSVWPEQWAGKKTRT